MLYELQETMTKYRHILCLFAATSYKACIFIPVKKFPIPHPCHMRQIAPAMRLADLDGIFAELAREDICSIKPEFGHLAKAMGEWGRKGESR